MAEAEILDGGPNADLTEHPASGSYIGDQDDVDHVVAAAAAELARIARVYDAATREGVGCLVLRDPDGQLVGAWVTEDVPRGRLQEVTTDAWSSWGRTSRSAA